MGGSFIVRLFVLPHNNENAEEVLLATESGSIRDISELKLRLWTTMQQDPVKGLNHQDVWQKLESHWPAFNGLATLLDIDVNHLQQASASTDLRISHFSAWHNTNSFLRSTHQVLNWKRNILLPMPRETDVQHWYSASQNKWQE